ncbi:sulfite reductase [NADPH] flavoprotein component, partial [Spiromyces aspiralis]
DPSETAAAADFRRESHLDFSALAFTSTAAEQREEVSLEIDAQTASGYIAYALSDICYVYSSPEQDIGSSVLSWSETKEPNLAGAWTTALRMQSRPGAGNALLGSLANGATPSVLASGAAVPYLLATIQSLVRDRVGVVFHITARTFDGEGCARSDLSEVLVGRQTGAVFLSSSTAQEAHDISLVAHAIARALRVPVIHIVNGDSSVSAKVAVRMATFSKLPEILESVAPPAELPA